MRLEKLDQQLARAESALSVLIVCVICFAVLFQVLSRFVLKVPLSWTEELSRFALIWLTFIAAAVSLRDDGHFAVDVIAHRLPPRGRRLYAIALLATMLVYLVAMLWTGLQLLPIAHMQESPALDLDMGYVYLSIPVGAALMIVTIVLKIARLLREIG